MKAGQLIARSGVLLTLTLSTLSISLAAAEINVTPPPDKAAIVVYRPAKLPGVLFQDNIVLPVAYDEQWVSSVSKGRHFVFYAWPGVHKIEPAMYRMAANDRCGSGTINLDVKASETYYIRVAPPEGASCPSGAALTLMDKESAQKDMADSKPADWAKDLVEGTLADVHPLGPQAGGGGAQYAPVEWIPDIDSVKTSAFKRYSVLNGTLFLQNDSLLLQLKPGSSDTVPMGVTIPYADIATVEVKNWLLYRIVLITRKNGRLDSFSVLTAGGGRNDRDQTKACRDQLATRLAN